VPLAVRTDDGLLQARLEAASEEVDVELQRLRPLLVVHRRELPLVPEHIVDLLLGKL